MTVWRTTIGLTIRACLTSAALLLAANVSIAAGPSLSTPLQCVPGGANCVANLKMLQDWEKTSRASCDPMRQAMIGLYGKRRPYYGLLLETLNAAEKFDDESTGSVRAILKPFEGLVQQHEALVAEVRNWERRNKTRITVDDPFLKRVAETNEDVPDGVETIKGRPVSLMSFVKEHIDAARTFDQRQEAFYFKWLERLEDAEKIAADILKPYQSDLANRSQFLSQRIEEAKGFRHRLKDAFDKGTHPHCIGSADTADARTGGAMKVEQVPGMRIPFVAFDEKKAWPAFLSAPPAPENLIFVRDGLSYLSAAYEEARDVWEKTYEQYLTLSTSIYQAGNTIGSVGRTAQGLFKGLIGIFKTDVENASQLRERFGTGLGDSAAASYVAARRAENLTVDVAKGYIDLAAMATEDISAFFYEQFELLGENPPPVLDTAPVVAQLKASTDFLTEKWDFVNGKDLNAGPEEFIEKPLRERGIAIDEDDREFQQAAALLYWDQTRKLRKAMKVNQETFDKLDQSVNKVTAYTLGLLGAKQLLVKKRGQLPSGRKITGDKLKTLNEMDRIIGDVGNAKTIYKVQRVLGDKTIRTAGDAAKLRDSYRRLDLYGQQNKWPHTSVADDFARAGKAKARWESSGKDLQKKNDTLNKLLEEQKKHTEKLVAARKRQQEFETERQEFFVDEKGQPRLDPGPVTTEVLPVLNPDGSISDQFQTIQTGRRLGAGTFQTVYASPDGYVIKVIEPKTPPPNSNVDVPYSLSNDPLFSDVPSTSGALGNHGNQSAGLSDNFFDEFVDPAPQVQSGLSAVQQNYVNKVFERTAASERLGRELGFRPLETTYFRNQDGGILSRQEWVPDRQRSEWLARNNGLTDEHRLALSTAVQHMMDNKMFHMDGHMDNWYFHREGGVLKAAPSDIDGLVRIDDPVLLKAAQDYFIEGKRNLDPEAFKALGIDDPSALANIDPKFMDQTISGQFSELFGNEVGAAVNGRAGLIGRLLTGEDVKFNGLGEPVIDPRFNGPSPEKLTMLRDELQQKYLTQSLNDLEKLGSKFTKDIKSAADAVKGSSDVYNQNAGALRQSLTKTAENLKKRLIAANKNKGFDLSKFRAGVTDFSLAVAVKKYTVDRNTSSSSPPLQNAVASGVKVRRDAEKPAGGPSYNDLITASRERLRYVREIRQEIRRAGMWRFTTKAAAQ